jgi:hypothetical protein
LHVLSTPPAFVLSQDQTLRWKVCVLFENRTSWSRFTSFKLCILYNYSAARLTKASVDPSRMTVQPTSIVHARTLATCCVLFHTVSLRCAHTCCHILFIDPHARPARAAPCIGRSLSLSRNSDRCRSFYLLKSVPRTVARLRTRRKGGKHTTFSAMLSSGFTRFLYRNL